MAIETERKFLVKGDGFKQQASKSIRIKQGYLSSNPLRSVRIRITSDQAFLTIKGPSSEDGMSRYEWEKEIEVSEADSLLELCEEGKIDKIRHNIVVGKHVFEVDEFLGENQGLLIAEIELNSADEHFEIPNWLGKEVTGEQKYYNSSLSRTPFKTWRT